MNALMNNQEFNNYQHTNIDASSNKSMQLDSHRAKQMQEIASPILPVMSPQLSSSGVFDQPAALNDMMAQQKDVENVSLNQPAIKQD